MNLRSWASSWLLAEGTTFKGTSGKRFSRCFSHVHGDFLTLSPPFCSLNKVQCQNEKRSIRGSSRGRISWESSSGWLLGILFYLASERGGAAEKNHPVYLDIWDIEELFFPRYLCSRSVDQGCPMRGGGGSVNLAPSLNIFTCTPFPFITTQDYE